MKNLIPILAVLLLISFQSHGQEKNKAILKYTESQLEHKIDRGECWDLVSFALSEAKADWKMPLDFGTVLKIPKQKLIAGDIMTFDNVKFEGDNYYTSFPMHYAIIYEVIDQDHIVIAHQNHNGIRKVQLLELTLSDQSKGKIIYHRAK